jgi:signal transduction histidine kinase
LKGSISHRSLSFAEAGSRWLVFALWLAVLAAHFPETTKAAELPPDGAKAIRAIQNIASRDPFTEAEIKVRGVVTWVDATVGSMFYVQDETGGLRVSSGTEALPEFGDEVFVQGMLTRGPFTPLVTRATFLPLGRGILPNAMNASGGGIRNGAFIGERVKFGGSIRSAEAISPTRVSMILDSGGFRLKVLISNFNHPDNLEGFIGGDLMGIGVVSPVKARDDFRQLVDVEVLIASMEGLILNRRGATDPSKIPITSLDHVFRYRPGQTRRDRKRTQGEIIYQDADVIYLNDRQSGLTVRPTNQAGFQPGQWVEATGFLDLESFLPVLSEAMLKASSEVEAPVHPEEFAVDELLSGRQHANYVTLSGRLVERMEIPARMIPEAGSQQKTSVFSVQTPKGVFTAELRGESHKAVPTAFQVGAEVKISGICLIQTDSLGNPTTFKILVPDPGNLSVTEPASYFTVRRLLVALSAVLGILLAATAAAFFFARRSASLKAELRERQAVTAERTRLAGDIHDTLEQGLTAIQLRLYSMDSGDGETDLDLVAARSLVQQCHLEMRQSVWNLRSQSSDNFNLAEALERTARSLVLGTSIEVDLEQQKFTTRLPLLVEDNLLRIGQEALGNAVRHAHPTRLCIQLATTPNHATLVISDNGCGMHEGARKAGHFGLVGMKERAARIGGSLTISSAPDSGTTIRVDVPLPTQANHS